MRQEKASVVQCDTDSCRFCGSVVVPRIDDAEISERAAAFRALADETRLRILSLLMEREHCVCEIMKFLDSPQSTTSHHLAILQAVGLIRSRKQGRWVFYRLDREAFSRYKIFSHATT